MNAEPEVIEQSRMDAAVAEMQHLILSHFPGTTFTVEEWDEPDSIYMRAIVDVGDTDEVIEVILDRLVEMQVEENLPIYVVPIRTPERVAAALERERTARAHFAMPS